MCIRVQVWDPATRTEIAQLDCSVTAMATGPLGPGGSLSGRRSRRCGILALVGHRWATGVTCPCMRLEATGVAPPQRRSRSRCPSRELRPPALTNGFEALSCRTCEAGVPRRAPPGGWVSQGLEIREP